MKLIIKATGQPVQIGQTYTIRGEQYTVRAIEPPRHPGSSGRVYVALSDRGDCTGFFPGVINAVWVEHQRPRVVRG